MSVQFALDLITGSFDSKLSKSKHELKDFSEQASKMGEKIGLSELIAPLAAITASVATIGGLMEGIHGAVDLGEDMVNLSNRTGIAVEQLYMLRRLFKDSGVEAEKIGPSIGKMQKYLEAAATTGQGAPLLRNIGLDSKAEAAKKPDQAFRDIGSALSQIQSPTERAASAIAIFGRQGAELLQVFMNPDFKNAGEISGTAERLGENAYLFKEAHDELAHVGEDLQGYFIGLAGPVMTAIKPLLRLADQIDLSGVGEQMGSFLENFVTDFDQQFEEVFSDLGDFLGDLLGHIPEFLIGAVGVLGGLVEKLGAALLFAFHTPLDYLQAAIQTAIEKLMEGVGNVPGLNNLTGTKGFKASSFDENLKQIQAEGNGATQLAREGSKEANETMGEGGSMIWNGLKESLASFKGAFTATAKSAALLSEEREKSLKKHKADLGGEGEDVQGVGKGQNSFADSLRKIGGGGFAGGQGDPLLDENKKQTGELVRSNGYLEKIGEKLNFTNHDFSNPQSPVIPGLQAPEIAQLQSPVIPGLQAPEIEPLQSPVIPGLQAPEIEPLQAPVIPGLKTPELPELKAPSLPPMSFFGGNSDPLLNESQRQTSLMQQMVSLLSRKSPDLGMPFPAPRFA